MADDGASPRISSTVELREALGSDVVVHVGIDAPPAMTDDMRELASDVGVEALEHVEQLAAGGRTTVLARLNPRSTVAKGERIELAVDTAASTSSIPTTTPRSTHDSPSDNRYKETPMRVRRLLIPLFALALVAAACGDDDDSGGGDGGDGGDGGSEQAENTGSVELLSAGEPEETDAYQVIFDELITADADYDVEVISAGDFAQQFQIQAEGGTLDVAAVPQPGAIADLAEAGDIVSLEDMGFDIDELNGLLGESFMALGEVDGKHYGLPTNINLKSMVWYPKDNFDAAGYEVPTTWDDLMALSDQIVATAARRGASASRAAATAAGRPPTGWRTSCSAPRGRRSTTSGTPTRSRSTTPP